MSRILYCLGTQWVVPSLRHLVSRASIVPASIAPCVYELPFERSQLRPPDSSPAACACGAGCWGHRGSTCAARSPRVPLYFASRRVYTGARVRRALPVLPHRTLARAWRGLRSFWLGWRGRGAGMARAWPVTLGDHVSLPPAPSLACCWLCPFDAPPPGVGEISTRVPGKHVLLCSPRQGNYTFGEEDEEFAPHHSAGSNAVAALYRLTPGGGWTDGCGAGGWGRDFFRDVPGRIPARKSAPRAAPHQACPIKNPLKNG
eukprot:gene24718-biopygen2934